MGKQNNNRDIDMSNPLLQQIVEGGMVNNPAYDPKKKPKKGAAPVPARIYDNTPKQVGTGLWDGIANSGQELHYDNTDLGLSVEEFNNYTEYGADPGPYKTKKELDTLRAKNQSAWEQTGNFVAQAVGNEIVLGTALGLSNLVDAATNLGKESGQNDYSSPMSLMLEDKQEEIRKQFEIYKENPEEAWQIGDFGWWADNAISVASTLSMLIPSMAGTKALGAVGKVARLEKLSLGIAKAAEAGNLTKGAYTLSKAINAGAEIGTAALLSRTMEGYLEARGVYKEVYDKSIDRLANMTVEDRTKLIKNNPEFANMTDEEIASNMSGRSADETFKNDYAMLLFDMAQFKALGSMWKGVTSKTVNAGLRSANKAAIAGLADEGASLASKAGFFAKRADIIKDAIKNPLTSLGAIEFSEGLEEGYQGIQTEKGKEVAEKLFDPTFNNRTLDSYLKDSSIWEQAFWGVLGGVGFQAAGTALGNVAEKVKGVYNKKTMTEQEYALSQMTEEKQRENEINSRQSLMKDYSDSMQIINTGKNPFGYKLDPDTKQPILQDGNQVNEDISDEEAEMLKTKLTNDFVTNMTLNATDIGNYDLLKEYITDSNFNKFFKEAGLESDNTSNTFSTMLINKMDDVHEQYNKALYDVMNSIDVKNENIAKAVSRSIARRKLEIADLYDVVDNLSGDISNNSDDINYLDYENEQRSRYAERVLNDIANKETQIQTLLDDKRVSPQAVAEISKENTLRRNQLLAFASTGNMFGNPEVLKNLLDSNIESADTNAFINEFNNYLSDLDKGTYGKAVQPKKSIQDLIKKKIELEDHADYLEQTLPTTQSMYQAEYDNIAMSIDRLTVDRYNKATDLVGEYIESQPDLGTARDNVMTNNVPENIKEQLDILKLGHQSTQRYTSQINAIIGQIGKDRTKAEQEAKNVTVDNSTTNDVRAEQEKQTVENVVAETDNRPEVQSDSSTGEKQQATPAVTTDPNLTSFNVEEEVARLDDANKDIIQQQVDDFTLDNDARAVGLASSITFNLFKTSRNLFDNLDGKDVNSAEFNNIVNIVADELFTQGVSRGYTQQAAIDGIRMAMNMIYRRLNSKGMSNADMFKVLADQLATKQKVDNVDDEGKASTTSLIPDGEFNKVVDSFIDSYISNRGIYTLKGSKTIINVEDLFKELLNNDGITFEQAKHIFFNIADYIRQPNNKYVFTNKTELNKNLKTPTTFFNNLINSKTIVEEVDKYMHIAAPNKPADGYNGAINKALNGGDITVEGFGETANSISIKSDGVEIGFLATVIPNNTNTGYSLRNQNQGFVYRLDKNNGIINSNLDRLFIPLINKENESMSKLMDISYKQFVYEQDSASPSITENEVKSVLSNPVIKELIANQEIKFDKFKVTDRQKAQFILNKINNVVFYDNSATTPASIAESYAYWKASTFNNYTNTHTIQQALAKNKKINTKLINISSGKVLLDSVNHDINTRGFTYEQNPIMIVDANNNIINERGNTSYNNSAGFESGTMGMLINDNPNAPVIALFTESNNISSSPVLANRVSSELESLFNRFQAKEINFEQLGNSLSDLLSGPGVKSNNLFSGYSVVKTTDKIALNIKGLKGQYNLIIHKFEKGTNREGVGITYIPIGDKTRSNSFTTPRRDTIKKIVKEITDNLTFNKTFYGVNNKNVDNDKSNQYLYKENGKLVVNIGGKKDVYDSFGHFVLTNNAFKTNQGLNQDGTYFDNVDKVKSLYINTAIISSPVEEAQNITSSNTASSIIKSATMTESVNTSLILDKAGVAPDKVVVITGDNQFGIELIPKESYFDNKATKAEAYYNKGKMFFTNRGANAISKSPNNLVRLLIHENLHAKFEEQELFQRDGIVDDLMNTYNAFIDAITNDNTSKEAGIIRKWVDNNKFNPNDYFTKLSIEQQSIWSNRSEEDRTRQFAEEWLVESLTQPVIINYLNNTIYTGETTNVEGLDNSAKTIWQKIIDVLLKLFGKNSGNIKNNSILAQQYSVLGNNTNATETAEYNVTEVVQQNADANTNGETPLSIKEVTDNADEKVENSPTNNISITGFQNEGRKLDETNEVDDLDFAITNLLESVDDVNIQAIRTATNVNMTGGQVVTDMDKYINQFAEQDKPIIARMMTSNEVKFSCQ